MLISEMMEIGLAIAPIQARNSYFKFEDGKVSAACALGDYLLAKNRDFASQELCDALIMGVTRADLPSSDYAIHPVNGERQRLDIIITSLNDYSLWSVRQIIDWLKGIGK